MVAKSAFLLATQQDPAQFLTTVFKMATSLPGFLSCF